MEQTADKAMGDVESSDDEQVGGHALNSFSLTYSLTNTLIYLLTYTLTYIHTLLTRSVIHSFSLLYLHSKTV